MQEADVISDGELLIIVCQEPVRKSVRDFNQPAFIESYMKAVWSTKLAQDFILYTGHSHLFSGKKEVKCCKSSSANVCMFSFL